MADPNDFLDDFALLSGVLVVCEIDSPFAMPDTSTSQLTVVARTGATPGEVVRTIPLANSGIRPSSVTRIKGWARGKEALLVTDYSSGGLYTVTF